MKYAVNEQGIQAMNKMASSVTEAVEEMRGLTAKVRSEAEGHQNSLGPHKKSLDTALSEIEQDLRQASEPAKGVAEKLTEVAEAYEEIIDNDRIKGAVGK